MRVIQVATRSWLVLDGAFRPRYLIVYAAAVHRATGETHMLYRVDQHNLEPQHRRPVAWVDTHVEAVEWCREVIETPAMNAPIVAAAYGSAITVEVQRERWTKGLDPATGKPRMNDEKPPASAP